MGQLCGAHITGLSPPRSNFTSNPSRFSFHRASTLQCLNMPSSKSRVTDIVCRLGLLAPYTRLATDWALQPAVRSLYVDGLNGISKQYCNSSNPDIRASHELRNEVERLLHQYGPVRIHRSHSLCRSLLQLSAAVSPSLLFTYGESSRQPRRISKVTQNVQQR